MTAAPDGSSDKNKNKGSVSSIPRLGDFMRIDTQHLMRTRQ